MFSTFFVPTNFTSHAKLSLSFAERLTVRPNASAYSDTAKSHSLSIVVKEILPFLKQPSPNNTPKI